jgi:hypothetical protein
MKFAVVFPSKTGEMFPLRGTVIAFSMDRAQHFESREAAQTALDKAAKFLKKATFKSAQIKEVSA